MTIQDMPNFGTYKLVNEFGIVDIVVVDSIVVNFGTCYSVDYLVSEDSSDNEVYDFYKKVWALHGRYMHATADYISFSAFINKLKQDETLLTLLAMLYE